MIHWGGDTRALEGRYVNWGDRIDVSATELASFRRGDPWLSAGLVKDGDPIYLAKWETSEAQSRLLHIQSIGDVQIFGIDSSNYGRFVIDRAEWERRYGFLVSTLQKAALPAAVQTGPAGRGASFKSQDLTATLRDYIYHGAGGGAYAAADMNLRFTNESAVSMQLELDLVTARIRTRSGSAFAPVV